MTQAHSLAKHANKAMVIKLIAAATTYGFSIVLARIMQVEDFGIVVIFLNIALILSVVGARGQQIAALRYVPILVNNPERSPLNSFVFYAVGKTIVTTGVVLILAVLFTIAARCVGYLDAFSSTQIALGFSLIPLVGWLDLQSHLARGAGHLSLSLIPKEIIWRGMSVLFVLAIFLQQGTVSLVPETVLATLAFSLIIVGLVQAGILRNSTRVGQTADANTAASNVNWKESTNSFWVTSVSNIFLANGDILIVGIVAGPKVAGIYFAANRLAMLLGFFLTSYNIVLGPMLAGLWHSNRTDAAQDMIRSTTLNTSRLTLALGLVLILFAPQFLRLFGQEFVQAALVLRLLVVAGIFNALSGPADIALNMCGFQRQAMYASTLSLAINATLLVAGALIAGATGIAGAVVCGTIVRKSIFWFLARKHMSIRTDVFAPRAAMFPFGLATRHDV